MADVALQSVVEILVPIIRENWKLISVGKEDSAHQLQGELKCLKSLLVDAAKYRQSNSKQWKNLVKELQVIVCKAEGLIDKLMVEVKLHQEKTELMQLKDAATHHKIVRHLVEDVDNFVLF
ncbi:hypothetical protein CQW23_23027 [Capsicum baccatum]|uniref:Disease resistance N-terminal domain-containing protein n=1 Tax=Capsicum baccatum TaxID=33114 RepID=A0A2G2W2K7_CAPBA|nr:hypothetical protein CQW23_23027 [Capsicum baccatum]